MKALYEYFRNINDLKVGRLCVAGVTENVAENFINSGGGDVIYEISNPKGYNICDISCSPNEAEIFFKSGSKFRVKKIEGLFIDIDKVGKKITLEYVE